jgi:hypothetical protein
MNKNHYKNDQNRIIEKLPLDNSLLFDNTWLAGYIDAIGNFYIRFPSKRQITCRFNLEQRLIYAKPLESYESILNKICLSLNLELAFKNRVKLKKSYYCLKIENKNSNHILIQYLVIFPLLSSKYLDYLDWRKVYFYIHRWRALDKYDRKDILYIKNNMNSKRNKYNWDHLNIEII